VCEALLFCPLAEQQESKISGDWQAHLMHITDELCGGVFQQTGQFLRKISEIMVPT
jgi:hypothetical protein